MIRVLAIYPLGKKNLGDLVLLLKKGKWGKNTSVFLSDNLLIQLMPAVLSSVVTVRGGYLLVLSADSQAVCEVCPFSDHFCRSSLRHEQAYATD